MNEQMPFDRLVAGWMDAHAAGAPEPLLDQILTTTGRMRPQPRWWALLAEAPMRRERTRVGVGLSNRGLVFAALIALLLAGLAAAAIGASILFDRPAPPDAADWPGFRGSADRAGIGLQGPTGDPVLRWRFDATGSVMDVAILGDRAYFASDDGRVYGVSRDRGTLLWSAVVPNPPLGGPFAADGQLYLTDSTGTVHAIAQADGTTVWTSTTAYPGPSRIVSVDGTVYFGTTDGFVVALDSVTGTERWRLQPPGATLVDAPAFGSGLLFAGTDGAGYVAIDPATQQVVWQGDTHGENTGTATVADGIAYIGVAAEATGGRLRAFEAKTGRLLWTAEDDLLQAPAVAEGVAFSSTNQGLAVGIDTATGATTWRLALNGQVSAPVVAGGVV